MSPFAPRLRRRLLPAAATLLLLGGLFPVSAASVLADSSVQSLPFSQNWNNTSLITANDDWSGVPGIVGYRGDGMASVAGVDPQTVLADGSGTPVDVNANIANPSTFGTGGVTEAEIADPTIALQGSGTARAPHLVIAVSTVGLTNVTVAYNLRDIDGSSDNTNMQVALQFRVGNSGNYTNVPAGYVADASQGGTATLVTPVSAQLPAAVDNLPLVDVRILMTDAPSTDEMIGVDDISISGQTIDQDIAPSVASSDPGAGGTVGVGDNLTVTFSEPVNVTGDWFTITCATTGAHTAAVSGGPTTFTLNPDADFVDGEACTLTVVATLVADQDGNDPPDNMDVDFTAMFSAIDVCAQPFTPIYDIQGAGSTAATTGNVTTAGVVVGDFEGGAAVSGFYLQDPTGDGDPATSDGIFVFTGGGNANTVSAGELVRVTGFARERFNQTTLNGSNSNSAAVPAANIVHCGTGSVAPTEVTMPFASTTFPERYEGMLVNFPQPLVISEYFNYARFGEIVLAQPLDGEDRPFTGTSVDEPGAAANARTAANAVRRITLDDNVSAQNPAVLRHPNGQPFSLTNRFRGGDTVANTTGILGFDFSLYRVYPTAPADYTATDPRPAAPEDVGGTLRAAAMNTLNFFLTPDAIQDDSGADNPADNVCGGNANLECRGWDGDQPAEFDRQRDKLLQALAGLDADVIGLNELENTPGVEPLLDPTRGVVAGLNAMPGVGPYDAIDTGVIGTDAIRVGIIYRSDVVRPVGAYKILDSTVDPRFIDTKNRPSVAQTFDVIATGARFTVVVNHLKSKGSDCKDVGDPDAGDGQGNCAGTREQAAKALVDWIATDPTGSGDRDYLILGDLNSYAMEDSIDAIRAGSDDTAGTADDFTNLIAQYQGPFAHSYVFDGQAGYLDHALASATLIGQVTGAADWHINSDEPDILDYDTTFKPPAQEALYEPNQYRTSDHDPVVVGLNLLSYHFDGFEAPVDNPPTLNIAKAGQSVPVKFQLAGDLGLGVLFGMPFAMQHTCGGGGPSDTVDASNPGGSGLQFDPVSNTYTYVWKTDKNWTNQCRTFEITFDDGTYRRAEFSFTK